jgi:DNA-directed RNA polymerase subunit RPC12/RpoP
MVERRPSFAGDGAWQQGPGAAPRAVDGVRCGSCGAHTPVLGVEPHCLYCAMPVELPSDVASRADELQRNIYIARGEAEELDRELTSEGAGYVNGILAAQIVGVLVSLALWVDLLRRASQSPTLMQLLVVAGALLGPALFVLIAQHFRVGAELRKLAKLSFARLEVEAQPTGIQMHLSCSGCGGAVDASQIEGLTIRCKHCNNAMLAPARLVDAGQRRYMQQVLALRRRLSRNVFAREMSLVVLGLIYLATAAVALVNIQDADPLTNTGDSALNAAESAAREANNPLFAGRRRQPYFGAPRPLGARPPPSLAYHMRGLYI